MSFHCVMTVHGTWLGWENGTRLVGFSHQTPPGQVEKLVAFTVPARAGLVFLAKRSGEAAEWDLPPHKFFGAMVPLAKMAGERGFGTALMSVATRQLLCAFPPASPDEPSTVMLNRDAWQSWETFHLFPAREADVSDRLRAVADATGKLLSESGVVRGIVAAAEDATALPGGVLAGLLPLLSGQEIDDFARRIADEPGIADSLHLLAPDDFWISRGLRGAARLANAQDAPGAMAAGERGPIERPAPVRGRPEILADMPALLSTTGLDGRSPTLGHALNASVRRLIAPRKQAAAVLAVRNEGPYLLEWVAYHRAIGIEAIFVYSNDNDDGSDELLAALADEGLITWLDNRLPVGGAAQRQAYGHALSINTDILDYRWTLMTDADEFLVLDATRFSSVPDFLAWHERQDVDVIGMNWVFIGSSSKTRWEPAPVTARFTHKYEGGANPHIKSFLRPNRFIMSWPHFPVAERRRCFSFRLANGETHHFRQQRMGELSAAFSDEPSDAFGAVYHYWYKSAEEFLWKFARNRGDYATVPGISTTDLWPGAVHAFVHQFDMAEQAADDKLSKWCPRLAADLEALRGVPRIAGAEAVIHEKIEARRPLIRDAFRKAQGILQAGQAGERLLELAGYGPAVAV